MNTNIYINVGSINFVSKYRKHECGLEACEILRCMEGKCKGLNKRLNDGSGRQYGVAGNIVPELSGSYTFVM